MAALIAVADLVAARGADAADVQAIAAYIADRASVLSLSSAHSSSHSSLHRDAYLRVRFGLTLRQVSAWLALIRGTRPVRRDGRLVGGRRGMVEALISGAMTEGERARFDRLAHVAATGRLLPPARGAGARVGAA